MTWQGDLDMNATALRIEVANRDATQRVRWLRDVGVMWIGVGIGVGIDAIARWLSRVTGWSCNVQVAPEYAALAWFFSGISIVFFAGFVRSLIMQRFWRGERDR